jgi:hypothetical protein
MSDVAIWADSRDKSELDIELLGRPDKINEISQSRHQQGCI